MVERMVERHAQKCLMEEFESLLAPILEAAYGMAHHLLRNKEEAEDRVQEAAILAFKAFPRFQKGTNFRAWFFKILINCVRYHCRKQKREPQMAPIDDAPDLYFYTQTMQAGLHGRNENPASLVIGKMSEEQIHAAISALPEDYRIVSSLYFTQEMAYQEIADVLDCPVGTVRSRLHRGRKLLQKALWSVAQEYNIVAELNEEGAGQRG
jgi:RNA polymerase sigma-70 factor, ECF subfamily